MLERVSNMEARGEPDWVAVHNVITHLARAVKEDYYGFHPECAFDWGRLHIALATFVKDHCGRGFPRRTHA